MVGFYVVLPDGFLIFGYLWLAFFGLMLMRKTQGLCSSGKPVKILIRPRLGSETCQKAPIRAFLVIFYWKTD